MVSGRVGVGGESARRRRAGDRCAATRTPRPHQPLSPLIPTSLSSLSSLSPSSPTHRAGTYAGAVAGLIGGIALGAATRLSPGFRSALGPSGRAACVALPALGVVFLEVEWEINKCAQRRSASAGAPRKGAAEPADILPPRSG